jgi:flagellar motor switch protein FliG
LSGPQKVAVLMLAVGRAGAAKLIERMNERELRDVYRHITELKAVPAGDVEGLFADFQTRMPARSPGGAPAGGRVDEKAAPPADGRGSQAAQPAEAGGASVFERLNGVGERVLAHYLRNEGPETVARVLSRLDEGHARRVLATLPAPLSGQVIVQLRSLGRSCKDAIEPAAPRAAAGAEAPAPCHDFAFEDIVHLDTRAIQTLVRHAETDALAVALKGASAAVREHVLAGMAERSSRLLREDMATLGTVPVGVAEAAQAAIVALAKSLARAGEAARVRQASGA